MSVYVSELLLIVWELPIRFGMCAILLHYKNMLNARVKKQFLRYAVNISLHFLFQKFIWKY